ncbi:hypothetical protein COCSUDRAFT_37929 [Coccomyxa subellipsoidea C-169]|uniref:RING-Gid-type domain-containing protein n=1 Tax=Coccomyxa subellipsoidea (strain C-169) TaxID=574566 RepID=I0YPE0_COCSC|nr:hypothetical protein COCSUDRAFT_37929 [Coccomyxa subellipsoidea C-169]EIE20259.1 hypothetical protein COCSUDRAFT_37929 [Coccomyxa subellipsoidea C-169]|eukprot:XP_005644803.1 hypothetical protein COCSUDRAFT_37929 [Coccomyxa subellipsoidea C-169]
MSTAENIAAALKDAERVCKKQKLCACKTAQCIDKLAEALRAAEFDSPDDALCPDGLHERLLNPAEKLLKDLTESTKDLHSAVNKLGKAVDKTFVQDICAAIRPVDFDQPTLNKVIAEHFYQQGNFRVGDAFVREAGIGNGDALKKPYIAMHSVLKEVLGHNLQPALHWTEEHKEDLRASNGSAAVSSFEFRLHRLQFLHRLQTAGPSQALAYARAHFASFQETEMGEIQRLMGCLCFVRRPGSSPYSDLMAPAQWNDAAREFARQCCGLLGQACESPLLVAVAAGSIALPTLLKLATVMAGQNQDFQTCTQLPVELELGSEFVFHSVFACPVSREQSTAENPPMLLPCGHVLCKQSLQKIAKSPARAFKCPYCPVEATMNSCRAIFFPDAE